MRRARRGRTDAVNLDGIGCYGHERSARAMLGVLRWVGVDDNADGTVLVGEGVNAVERGDDLRREVESAFMCRSCADKVELT